MEPLLSGLPSLLPWLINYSIDISILICFIFIIKSIATKKLPAWWHYSLWIILLLRMILPVKFESSPLNIPSVVPISIDESLFESVLIEKDIVASTFMPELSSSTPGWNLQVDDMVLFLWLACAMIFGLYILVKNIKFQNYIKKEPLLTEKKVLALLEECKSRMKIRTTLKITLTDKVKSPALFGYLRPRLLLPVGILEKLDYAELSYIFMHELGHLKRHDIGVSWIITFLQILQWFNPLVWIAFHQMRIDQESACDASVLSRIKNHHTIDYASTIVGFLENFCQNRKLPAMVGILENRSQIKKRITMIVNYRKYSKTMILFSSTLLIIVGVVFFSFVGFAKAKHEQPGLDTSIFQALPLEVQGDLIILNNDVSEEKDAVKIAENVQDTPIVSQTIVVKDEMVQERSDSETQIKIPKSQNAKIEEKKESVKSADELQNISTVSQEIVVKDTVTSEKPGNEPQKAMVEELDSHIKTKKETLKPAKLAQNDSTVSREIVSKDEITKETPGNEPKKVLVETEDTNINDEKEAVRSTEGAQKESAEALKLAKELVNPSSSEAKNIKEYYPVAGFGDGQITEAAPSSQKKFSTGEENSMNYLGLAGVAYLKSENPDTSKGIPTLKKNEPDDSLKHDIKGFDEKPKIVSMSPLVYPRRARLNHTEGRVLLRFTVDKDGSVKNPQVVSAEPEGVFEQAALDTVVKYKLKPAVKDGKNVSSIVNLAISFSMDDNRYLKFAQR